MDGSRFDLLTRALGNSVDRRAGVRGLLAGAVAALGLSAAAEAAPKEEQCLRNGQRCGKKSGSNGGPCKRCCSRYWTKGNKRNRCTCKPDGMRCNNSSQCCNGRCEDRFCGGRAQTCIAEGGACPDGSLDCCDGLDCIAGACQQVCSPGSACENDADCCSSETCVGEGVGAACCASANACGAGADALCCADGEECGGNAADGFFCCPGTACGLACCSGATPVCASPGICTAVAGTCPGGSCTGGPGFQGTCASAACNCNGDPGVCVPCSANGTACTTDAQCCGVAVCCAGAGNTCQAVCI